MKREEESVSLVMEKEVMTIETGYGYFYVRLYWTGFGLNANIVEEYVLLAALLHVFVALKRH